VYPVLFTGEDIRVERPAGLGEAVKGLAAGCGALALAALLALKVWEWPISWPLFLAATVVGVLALLGSAFLVWAYGCLTLRYVLTPQGLGLRSGLLWGWVPWCAVQEVGRWAGRRPSLGLGPCRLERGSEGRVLDFALRGKGLVFVRAQKATYLLSPRDPVRFLAQTRFLLRLGREGEDEERAERRGFLSHPIFGDGLGQGLLFLALALGLAVAGYVMAVYPALPEGISLKLPPLGEPGPSVPKKELLRIPGTALAILGLDVGLALLSYVWERMVAHLLLAGGIVLEALFMVAAVIAVARA